MDGGTDRLLDFIELIKNVKVTNITLCLLSSYVDSKACTFIFSPLQGSSDLAGALGLHLFSETLVYYKSICRI